MASISALLVLQHNGHVTHPNGVAAAVANALPAIVVADSSPHFPGQQRPTGAGASTGAACTSPNPCLLAGDGLQPGTGKSVYAALPTRSSP